jgi:hypothetical protein
MAPPFRLVTHALVGTAKPGRRHEEEDSGQRRVNADQSEKRQGAGAP